MKLFYFSSFTLLSISIGISAQYNNSSQLAARIKALDQKEGMASTALLVKTAGDKDIYLVTVGKGDTESKPGIAVIGGIKGSSLASAEIVLQMLEKMVRQDPAILDEVTFYFFPNVSPDASEQYFGPLHYEREENARPCDDDRDGLTEEDGYDDLNNDGMITWMRIKDPAKGVFMIHPDNPSIMVKADIAKNQVAEYVVMREGIDNDKDGALNEDIPGGTIFNKNFSFNYPLFEHGAGENAISEEE